MGHEHKESYFIVKVHTLLGSTWRREVLRTTDIRMSPQWYDTIHWAHLIATLLLVLLVVFPYNFVIIPYLAMWDFNCIPNHPHIESPLK